MVFCVCLCTCTSKKIEENSALVPISIEPEGAERVLWDSLFDISSIQVIPLETIDRSLLGRVERLRVTDSVYAVLSNSSIYLFDRAGKFSLNISRRGRGPGEYLAPEDFYLDRHSVWVLDRNGQKIIEYSREGDFIREVNTGLRGCAFVHHNDSSWCIYTASSITKASEYQLNYLSKTKGEITGQEHLITGKESGWRRFLDQSNFFLTENGTYLSYFLNDTIYKLSTGKAIPCYVFDGGKYKFPDRILKKGFDDIMDFFQTMRNYFYIFCISPIVSKDGIYFSFTLHDEILNAYYSAKTGSTRVINKYDNFLGVPGLTVDCLKAFMPNLYDHGFYYYLVDLTFFTDARDRASFIQKYKLPDLDEYDNPVILKVKMKHEK